jgi:hypothetical protein
LEWLTGEKVVNGCNFLPPSTRKNWAKSEQEFVKANGMGKKTACRSRAHAVFFKEELKKSVLV